MPSEGVSFRARTLLAARRSAEDGAGGADAVLGVAAFARGATDFTCGGADSAIAGAGVALAKSDLIGRAPPLPNLVARSVAAACKSSKHGSAPCAALQRARARR